MANNRIFVNPNTILKVGFLDSQSISAFVNCASLNQTTVNSKVGGSSQVRRLGFPSSWITANVSFIVYEDATFTNGKVLHITDGVDNIPLLITNCLANTTISLQAPWIDSVNYFQIQSSVAQGALEVDCIIDPIYQVAA